MGQQKKDDRKNQFPQLTQTGLPPISNQYSNLKFQAALGTHSKKQLISNTSTPKQVETAPLQQRHQQMQQISENRPFSEEYKGEVADSVQKSVKRPLQKIMRIRQSLHKEKAQVQFLLPMMSTLKKAEYAEKAKGNEQQKQVQTELFTESESTQPDVFQKEWMKISWKQGEFIGSGSFGQVFQAMNTKTGQIFALKKIEFRSQFDVQDLEQLQNELLLMRKLHHKHIIKYLGHEQTEDYIHIYLEYMSQGNLTSILNKFGPLTDVTIRSYSRQILQALEHLHSNRVVHRDIKGANILVDTNGIVKIADFGCSSQMEKTMTIFRSSDKNAVDSLKGSIPWMPPEVITQTKYDTSADIWSFGCTVLEMATAKVPWSEYDFDNPIAAILKIGLEEDIPNIPSTLSPDLVNFISQCLQRNPCSRPTAQKLLLHKFLKDDYKYI